MHRGKNARRSAQGGGSRNRGGQPCNGDKKGKKKKAPKAKGAKRDKGPTMVLRGELEGGESGLMGGV